MFLRLRHYHIQHHSLIFHFFLLSLVCYHFWYIFLSFLYSIPSFTVQFLCSWSMMFILIAFSLPSLHSFILSYFPVLSHCLHTLFITWSSFPVFMILLEFNWLLPLSYYIGNLVSILSGNIPSFGNIHFDVKILVYRRRFRVCRDWIYFLLFRTLQQPRHRNMDQNRVPI